MSRRRPLTRLRSTTYLVTGMPRPATPLERRFVYASRGFLLLAGALPLVTLVSYLSGMRSLRAPFPGLAPMYPLTALLLLGLCVALAFESIQQPGPAARALALAFGWLMLVLCAAAFLHAVARAPPPPPEPVHSLLLLGNPELPAAVGLVLTAMALALVLRLHHANAYLVEVLLLSSSTLGLFALGGYLFGSRLLAGGQAVEPERGVALYTSLSICAWAVAALAAQPRHGMMALISSPRAGGEMARKLLAAVVFIPAMGVLVVIGEGFGFYDSATARALMSVVAIVVLAAVVLFTAARLNRADLERERFEREAVDLARRNAQSVSWFRTVVEQMPDGVILLDDRGKVAAMNHAARSLAYGPLGRTDRFGNDVLFDIRDEHDVPIPDDQLPLIRAFTRNEMTTGMEVRFRLPDERRVPALASATPIRWADGTVAGAVTVVQDITAMKELEALRQEWASVIAHDLRQPAAVISMVAQMIPRLHKGEPTAAEDKALERIVVASGRLKRMIEDLLDFSRIEAHRLSLEREPLDLAMSAKEAADRTRELGGAEVLTFAQPGSVVLADPARVDQVLSNLLSNAVKYGEPGKPIRVDVRNVQGGVHLVVTNHGAGIPENELGTLFNRFARTSSARHDRVEGLGLGLYICKGIVEAHGGRIWAESRPGELTSFHVLLPRLSSDALHPPVHA